MESTTHGATGRPVLEVMRDTIAALTWEDDTKTVYAQRHRNGIDLTIRRLSSGSYRAIVRDSYRGLVRRDSTPEGAATTALTDYINWINS